LEEVFVFNSYTSKITEEVKEHRFSMGKGYPHCKSQKVSRNRKYNDKQRYICKSCRKTFINFTNSATYKSNKTLDKWLEYAKFMLNGYSIRKSAELVDINIATSFFWRHKILN
jgi:transposase-like protein